MNGEITFNTNSLQTYDPLTRVGIITESINHTSLPDQVLNLFSVANANKSAIAGQPDFPSRVVTIAGTIVGSTVADLAQRADAFNAYFTGKNKNLDINYAGSTRRYIATRNALSVTIEGKKLFAPFTAQFVCTEPFGMDTATTNLFTRAANTLNTFTETPAVGGTAPYQLPIFTIHLNSFTGAGDYVQISNDENGQEILIYGVGLVAGDVIEINGETRKVTVNGTEVDYYGTFLELEPGSSSITYTDGFTTRNVNVVATYTKRYI